MFPGVFVLVVLWVFRGLLSGDTTNQHVSQHPMRCGCFQLWVHIPMPCEVVAGNVLLRFGLPGLSRAAPHHEVAGDQRRGNPDGARAHHADVVCLREKRGRCAHFLRRQPGVTEVRGSETGCSPHRRETMRLTHRHSSTGLGSMALIPVHSHRARVLVATLHFGTAGAVVPTKAVLVCSPPVWGTASRQPRLSDNP